MVEVQSLHDITGGFSSLEIIRRFELDQGRLRQQEQDIS
jgi:hypothetical protein